MKRLVLASLAVAVLALAPAAEAAQYESFDARLDGYDLRLDWVESGLIPGHLLSFRITMNVQRTLACSKTHSGHTHKPDMLTTDSTSYSSGTRYFLVNPFSTREVFALIIRLMGPAEDPFAVFPTPPACHDGSQPRVVAVTYSHIELYDDIYGISAPAFPNVISYTA
jgi:hypothetical protein